MLLTPYQLIEAEWHTFTSVNRDIIGSDSGLSPDRGQAIIWTNAGILLIGPLWTKFSEILIETHTFSLEKMHLKMSSRKWRPFCLGLNVLSMKKYMSAMIADDLAICLHIWSPGGVFFTAWKVVHYGMCRTREIKIFTWIVKLWRFRMSICLAPDFLIHNPRNNMLQTFGIGATFSQTRGIITFHLFTSHNNT